LDLHKVFHLLQSPKHGLFITGTGTDVGKTYVACQIAAGLLRQGRSVGVYKPIASGCRKVGDQIVADDAVKLWEAAGQPLTLDDVCPQRFLRPIAPHLAAQADGREADFDLMLRGLEKWRDFDIVIVEGAGGLMSPVSLDSYSADLAYEFGFPTIVVAANRLGVINESLQTLIVGLTFREGLTIGGIVLNDVGPSDDSDASRTTNLAELRLRCVPPVIAHVAHGGGQQELEFVDWLGLAGG
jgi:dethiobiotin synthetase